MVMFFSLLIFGKDLEVYIQSSNYPPIFCLPSGRRNASFPFVLMYASLSWSTPSTWSRQCLLFLPHFTTSSTLHVAVSYPVCKCLPCEGFHLRCSDDVLCLFRVSSRLDSTSYHRSNTLRTYISALYCQCAYGCLHS